MEQQDKEISQKMHRMSANAVEIAAVFYVTSMINIIKNNMNKKHVEKRSEPTVSGNLPSHVAS